MMHWRLGASKGPRAGTLRTGSDRGSLHSAAYLRTTEHICEKPPGGLSVRPLGCSRLIPWARSGLEDLTRRCIRSLGGENQDALGPAAPTVSATPHHGLAPDLED